MKSSPSQTDYTEEDIRETSLETPRRKNWWWLLILPILLGGGYLGWRSFNGEKKAPAAASGPPPARVKLASVQAGAIEDSSEFVASLESRQSVNLQPRVQGQVSQIFVKSGARVNSGDAIIQIDSRQQQAAVSTESASVEAANSQLDNARATLRSLQAQRLSNEADVKLEQQEYQRYTTLAAQGAVSRQTRDQYANRLATAQATLRSTDAQIQAQLATIAQAEKTIKQAQARTREQQVQLQYYKITAPFAGIVGDIPVKVGDFVNTSTQLTTITQNQPLEVNISVPIERGLQLRQGMPVEVLDAQGRTIGMSRIFFIASSASNNNTQTILVKSLLDNTNDQLRADQFTRARIIWNQRLGVLVPATAIARIAGETFVYVTQTAQSPDGKSQPVARQKRVKLGSIKGNNYQVIEGLQPGERIIVSGLLNLRDGAPVVPES